MRGILRIRENISNTTFKQSFKQLKDLKKLDPTYMAKSGTIFFVSTLDRGSSDPKSQSYYGGDHWKVTFKDKLKPAEGGDPIQTWYVFRDHVEEYRFIP